MAANLGDALRGALSNHPDEASPDIAARVGQIANLADERRAAAPAQGVAAELAKVAKAQAEEIRENGPMSLSDRAALAKATRADQERYLAEVSPGGHAAYQSARDRAARGEL